MLDSFYKTKPSESKAFGPKWCGPDRFAYCEEVLIAKYDCPDDSDGQPVEVYCTAMPARFYKLKVLPKPNSGGEEQPGYVVSTGSGQNLMAAAMALSISEGMLAFDPLPLTEESHVGPDTQTE